ncbi:ATP-binding protein [Streptomyces sp. NPDC005479]|uniref:ATP-binding protein n=1 Tax=unclassified Streptomyces TaxID=2593676 RepID=UPI0033BA8F45
MDTMSVTVVPARSATPVAVARYSARDFLAGLVDPIPAEADTVVLVVSELVTNALRHGFAHELRSSGGASGAGDGLLSRRWAAPPTLRKRSAVCVAVGAPVAKDKSAGYGARRRFRSIDTVTRIAAASCLPF